MIGGPDVWEIVGAIRSMPERGEARVPALAERLGISENKVRVAIRYYGDYPAEIDTDTWIASNDEAADRLEAALAHELKLLG